MKAIIATTLGAAVGFAWWKFVGCSTGACPLSSNVVISVAWGAIMGYMLVAP